MQRRHATALAVTAKTKNTTKSSAMRHLRKDNWNRPITEFCAGMDSTAEKILRSLHLNQGSSSVPISEYRLRIWHDPWQCPRMSSARGPVQAYFPASEVQAYISE